MIDLYTWTTPNGYKIHIMLEECGLAYAVHPVDIVNGDQFKAEFLAIAPNNKLPAIVDSEGPEGRPFSVFESGAILIYLAEKTGQFMPPADQPEARSRVHQWLMFQMANVGPMLGQAHHFRAYTTERIQYGYDRYTNETARLYGVIDKRLGESPFLAGDDYSIADIATFPWIRSHEMQGQDLADYPNLKRWYDGIDARPAVQRGLAVLSDLPKGGPLSDEQRDILFGEEQYKRR
jgi:GST-like protein